MKDGRARGLADGCSLGIWWERWENRGQRKRRRCTTNLRGYRRGRQGERCRFLHDHHESRLLEGQYTENLMPVNYVMLAVVSGIIGLVLTGFTAWHISLAWRGQTTIECLETTRYLSPLRRSMQNHYPHQHRDGNGHIQPLSYGEQLREIHTNALPGITRPEEGEARLSPSTTSHPTPQSHLSSSPAPSAAASLQNSYQAYERLRAQQSSAEYLDEMDSERLPNAFDLGWRRNLRHLFGEPWWFWCLPVCNTTGDGWSWEVNPKWEEAREGIRREREGQWQKNNGAFAGPNQWHHDYEGERHYLSDRRSLPHSSSSFSSPSQDLSSTAENPEHADLPSDDEGYDDDRSARIPLTGQRRAEGHQLKPHTNSGNTSSGKWRDWG